MLPLEGMITVAEAATRLDRSLEQVRRYLREGKLKGQRIGGQWFIDKKSLGLMRVRRAPASSRGATEAASRGVPRNSFHIDLGEIEGTFLAQLAVWPTTSQDRQAGRPSGVTISVDRGAHGADLHLTWPHVKALRDELDRFLREAGQVDE